MTKKQETLAGRVILMVKGIEDKKKKLTKAKIQKANALLKKGGKEVGLEIEVKQVRSEDK